MSYAMEYCVALPLADVRDRVRDVLVRHGYAVQFNHGDHGTAERGSTRRETTFGFLARHVRFRIRLSAGASVTVIQVERDSGGWVGDLLVGSRHDREVARVRDALAVTLDAACLMAA